MKKTKLLSALLAILLLTLSLTSCGQKISYADTVFVGMDTVITLRLAKNGVSEETLTEAAEQCQQLVASYEKILSAHEENSDVAALNKDVQMQLDTDPLLLTVLDTAFQITELTDGAYDPTIGSLTSLWNITGGGPVPERGDIREAMKHVGVDKLTVDGTTIIKNDQLTQIDLGGVGKGYTLQAMLTYLSSTDIPYGIVSMGGNIGVFGTKGNDTPYKIGIKDPRNTDSVVGYLYAGGGFVSVSGDYERYFEDQGERYHHIIDPETGYPADNGLTSVICYTQNGASADALSTALFVMGLEESLAFYKEGSISFEAIFITEDYKIYMTDGIREKDLFELTASKYTIVE
ncbi:MAG: FAD:protein FMN transferase [Clostridia bacterium]|nr:FAD:protein FMN transferase [Clostridia bacterium]